MLCFLESKSKRIKQLVGTQPDKAVGPHHDVGLENVLVLAANARIDAVTGNHQICIGVLGVALHIGLELKHYAQRFAARLQNVE